ncbi:MarR family winged helix-turn-helix transcriptional regulator [Ornithinicoccus halotolerans]|uniref:MarR family winged helix-turn-helix transcriptional regulator n=1 Tax=Ornithinicoccus halotolerans TaxID=1748220 RepID=UPI0012970445|nr:MarR family winged helix-turn-helix transcriptional regulator [Ornithinicoccus halotolerans]
MTTWDDPDGPTQAVPEDDPLPDHYFRWAEAATRRMRAEVFAQAEPRHVEIRGSQGRVLQLIPRSGMRVTDLAERAHMTKQALGQLVRALEARGAVVIEPDERDARVRIVRRTELGDRASADLNHAITLAEETIREQVGPAAYDQMLQTMRDIAGTDF